LSDDIPSILDRFPPFETLSQRVGYFELIAQDTLSLYIVAGRDINIQKVSRYLIKALRVCKGRY
jgi:hypothetical protein